MREWLAGLLLSFVSFLRPAGIITPVVHTIDRSLDLYTIENLTLRGGIPSDIVFDEATATTSAYTVKIFHYTSDNKKVTGLAHIPTSPEPVEGFPVIVQFRGYVDRSIYKPGIGTRHSAEVFAQNGFISYAPDFLGYGGSDMPSANIFKERFQTYTAALDLLASIRANRVGIWAHSNGGQIALTVLEALQKPIPTTLWAPQSAYFPYSILYYTHEAEDKGKLMRKKLSEFERDYDVDLYTMRNYLDRLQGPMQVHQGTADDAIPIAWTNAFVSDLKKVHKDVTYYTYPGADHDMQGAWDQVIQRDIEFFKQN